MDTNLLCAKPIRQGASYAALLSALLSTSRIRASEVGVALIEVLIAILIMGIGLLALLTLFPLGAIEMAQAIRDDRTAAVAADAVALGEAGEELVTRTMDFVKVSLAQGSADATWPLNCARITSVSRTRPRAWTFGSRSFSRPFRATRFSHI